MQVPPRAIGALIALSVLLMLSSAGAANKTTPATPVDTAVGTMKAADGQEAPARDIYGPILSRDPATRAQIKHLYVERHELEQEIRGQIETLSQKLRNETDPDFRFEINAEIGQLKRDLELGSMELGLEIARLNEDERRIADFELALDQLLHPEKYHPAKNIDSARERQRSRAPGVE